MNALLNRQSLLAASRTATRSAPLISRRAFLLPSAARLAANPQSGKPASDDWTHTAKNIKQEAGQVASSLGRSVSGIDGSKSMDGKETQQTSEIMSDAVRVWGEKRVRAKARC